MPLFERKVVDPRVLATRSIGGTTIAALAMCIPMVAIMKSLVLPFAVIAGSAVAIGCVWFFGRSKVVATHSKEIEALEETVDDLKERLENVEVMNRYETVLAERSVEIMRERKMGSPVVE